MTPQHITSAPGDWWPHLLQWFDTHGAGVQALAAIGQAVLSIVAIGFAIWVPWSQQRRLERQANLDRLAEARSLSWQLTLPLLEFEEDLSRIEIAIVQALQELSTRQVAGTQAYHQALATAVNATILMPPAELVRVRDSLHCTGTAASALAERLLTGVANFNRQTDLALRLVVADDVRWRLTEMHHVLHRIEAEEGRVDYSPRQDPV